MSQDSTLVTHGVVDFKLMALESVSNRSYGDAIIIASSLVTNHEALPTTATNVEHIPNLLNQIEEADSRLLVHVDLAVRVQQCKRVVIVFNNTDKFALLLNYMHPIYKT